MSWSGSKTSPSTSRWTAPQAGDIEFLPHPEAELVVDSTWTEIGAFLLLLLFILVVLGLVAAALAYLVTRLF